MTAPSVVAADRLAALLSTILQPNSEAIRQAEAEMKQYLTQPAFICDLFMQLQSSPSAELRQLAAVLVRKRVGSLWLKLEPPVRTALQAALLQRLGVEPERVVRRSLTSVVGVVAKSALPKGEWPELAGYLFEATRSAAPEHRELSMQLLASLLDSEDVVEVLRPHFGLIAQTLQLLLADQSSEHVRRATLKAVSAWIAVLLADEDTLKEITPLLPALLDACHAAARGNDEESLACAFELLQEVVECTPNSHIAPQLAPLLEMSLHSIVNANFEEETRIAALNLLITAVEHKRKLVIKQKLTPVIVTKLFEALADAAGALGDDDDDETLEKRSAGAIHQLAMSIPAKHAAQPILQTARAFAADAAVPAKRRAAILGLAMAAEGCCDVFEESLSLLLPLVYAACADSVQAVREAACIALGEFAQNLQPAIIAHYETVLPHIFMVRAPQTQHNTNTPFSALFAHAAITTIAHARAVVSP